MSEDVSIADVLAKLVRIEQAAGTAHPRAAPARTHPDGGGDPRRRYDDEIAVPDLRVLAPGELLFAEGDASGCAYFVEQGEIEVFVRRSGVERPVGRVRAGEVVGEMGVIDHAPRSANARAAVATRLRVVDAQVLDDMLAGASPGLRSLFSTLTRRLRDAIPRA